MYYAYRMALAIESMDDVMLNVVNTGRHSAIVNSLEWYIEDKSVTAMSAIIAEEYLKKLQEFIKFRGSAPAGIDPEKLKKILETIVVIKGGKS